MGTVFEISQLDENKFSFASHPFDASSLEGIKFQVNNILESWQFSDIRSKRKLNTIAKAFMIVNYNDKSFSFVESVNLPGEFVVLTEYASNIALMPKEEIKECALTLEKCHISQLVEVREDEESEESFLVKKTLSHDELFCPECGDFLLSHADEIVRTQDGEIYCSSDCATENGYELCSHCGCWEQDCTYIDNEGEFFCNSCLNRLFRVCYTCNNWVRRSDALEANDGSSFCDSECARESEYYPCEDCGEFYHINDLLYSDYRDAYYCEDCYTDEAQEGRDRLNSYRHERPATFLHTDKDEKGARLYGGKENELEFSSAEDFNGAINELLEISESENDLIILKEDGSLNDLGFEIVTLPITLNWHKVPENAEKFKNIFRILKKYNAEASERCGMHVHLSRAGITEEHEIKLEMFFQLHRENLYTVAGRGENSYARFPQDRDITNKENLKAKNCDGSRYRCLNWCNERTVEIRIFAAVTEYADFMKNFEFAHCVYQYTKLMDIDTVEKADFLHFLEFAKNADNYPHFVDFINEKFN